MPKAEDKLPDPRNDRVGGLLKTLASLRASATKKERRALVRDLRIAMNEEGYFPFDSFSSSYHLSVVGDSCLYDISPRHNGKLKQFAGQRVRVVCSGSGPRWKRKFMAKPFHSSDETKTNENEGTEPSTGHLMFQSSRLPMIYPSGLHVLTYAEEGFSPLDIHARHFGVPRPVTHAFVETVNQREEVGTLCPAAQISAVPRSCIRDASDPRDLVRHLQDFLDNQDPGQRKTCLLIDFRTPRLQRHVREGISVVFGADPPPWLGEIIVIDD